MAQKTTKGTVRRRRERKNIERGAAHIQSTFNNTIVPGQCHFLGQLRRAGLPGLPEVHPLRRADGCRDCREDCHGAWHEVG